MKKLIKGKSKIMKTVTVLCAVAVLLCSLPLKIMAEEAVSEDAGENLRNNAQSFTLSEDGTFMECSLSVTDFDKTRDEIILHVSGLTGEETLSVNEVTVDAAITAGEISLHGEGLLEKGDNKITLNNVTQGDSEIIAWTEVYMKLVISDITVEKDVAGGKIILNARLENRSTGTLEFDCNATVYELGIVTDGKYSIHSGVGTAERTVSIGAGEKIQTGEFEIEMRDFDAEKFWSVDNPYLYEVKINANGVSATYRFGMYELTEPADSENGYLHINGEPIFLCGTDMTGENDTAETAADNGGTTGEGSKAAGNGEAAEATEGAGNGETAEATEGAGNGEAAEAAEDDESGETAEVPVEDYLKNVKNCGCNMVLVPEITEEIRCCAEEIGLLVFEELPKTGTKEFARADSTETAAKIRAERKSCGIIFETEAEGVLYTNPGVLMEKENDTGIVGRGETFAVDVSVVNDENEDLETINVTFCLKDGEIIIYKVSKEFDSLKKLGTEGKDVMLRKFEFEIPKSVKDGTELTMEVSFTYGETTTVSSETLTVKGGSDYENPNSLLWVAVTLGGSAAIILIAALIGFTSLKKYENKVSRGKKESQNGEI